MILSKQVISYFGIFTKNYLYLFIKNSILGSIFLLYFIYSFINILFINSLNDELQYCKNFNDNIKYCNYSDNISIMQINLIKKIYYSLLFISILICLYTAIYSIPNSYYLWQNQNYINDFNINERFLESINNRKITFLWNDWSQYFIISIVKSIIFSCFSILLSNAPILILDNNNRYRIRINKPSNR